MSDIETLDVVVKRHLQTSARCKVLETGEDVNYKASLPFDLVQGEILTIEVNKRWSHRKFDYLSGEITTRKIDVNALGLEPLECIPVGEWDPKEHYWGDENEHLEPWAKPIYDFGKRQQYEIAEIIPGFDPKNWQDNPMLEATYLLQEGTLGKAREKFEDMLEKDFRCIEAYSHLAGMEFEINPFWASRFYQMGMGIGMMSLGEDFNGVLPWGFWRIAPSSAASMATVSVPGGKVTSGPQKKCLKSFCG